jgi:ribosomal protein S18 acetylase RimI-like enzyme
LRLGAYYPVLGVIHVQLLLRSRSRTFVGLVICQDGFVFMRIERIEHDKKRFLDLLLLADEQENMIDRYLERGDMFALFDDDLKSVCVVARLSDSQVELKNIATYPKYRKMGYGKKLIEHICGYYGNARTEMLVGTGDVPSALRFYEHCGFTRSHVIENFFVDNYDKPMVEDGIQLRDMVYLKKRA